MKKTHSLEILFEDDWIVVVNKPSGMLSVGFPGYRGKTAQDILTDRYRSRGKIRIAVIHRLDRDTSGIMMFAKSAESKKRFMDDWQEIVTKRTYRCVCGRLHGAAPLEDSSTINEPLAYNRYDVAFVPRPGDRAALKDAEKAITHYRVIARGPKYDLVECELETGRKNQIRAHMAHLGHPVAGDEVYGKALVDSSTRGESDNPRDHDAGPIGRLALHARVLAFNHPFTGTPHRFEEAESKDFERVVNEKTRRTTRGTARDTAPGEGDATRVPRRQRGKKPVEAARKETAESRRERERDGESTTALAPVPKKSRTRQDTGKSRFIPGK